jgi:hypothetical protein
MLLPRQPLLERPSQNIRMNLELTLLSPLPPSSSIAANDFHAASLPRLATSPHHEGQPPGVVRLRMVVL